MRSSITTDSKLNEIRMLMNRRGFKSKVFVLIEGKTDLKLFRKLFDTTHVQLEVLDGKENVTNVVSAISHSNLNRIVGICDADFDHLNLISSSHLVFFTDKHDSETMILHEVGVDSIIGEYAKPQYLDGLKRNLLKKALEISFEIGLLKWVNSRDNYNLCFKEIEFDNFMTINNLNIEFSIESFINEVIHHSNSIDYSVFNDLIEKVNILRVESACEYLVCCGHDITKIISLIMSQPNLSIDTPYSQARVESDLRKSYGHNDFIKSDLYGNLYDWSQRNAEILFPLTN
ncbi:DUF4435 domain-containing protein [Photobacterium carnosum]|uniref:DUF4435 domain-containing protein n=1 Tax=Photobacterium carnosum TaxID=2023717 RepID=UPI001E3CF599|nr:DUF4435 domain-containing protein [Photobacterium carnosum]MCD9500481.1 DUF4435 domain-containing protein [Photobacterium carnosum]